MAKSTKTKGTTKAKGAKKRSVRALPPALRKNAEAMAANARKALKKRAKQALVDAKAAYAESLRGLWEFGVALTVLAEEGVAKAAGWDDGFEALCAEVFALDAQSAQRLVRAVSHVTEEQFAELGVHTINARLDLAVATPAEDTAEILAGKTVVLWEGGPSFDVGAASVRAVVEATKKVRAHLLPRASATRRGRTTTPAERTAAEKAAKALRKRGFAAAVVKVFATKAGAPRLIDVDERSPALTRASSPRPRCARRAPRRPRAPGPPGASPRGCAPPRRATGPRGTDRRCRRRARRG